MARATSAMLAIAGCSITRTVKQRYMRATAAGAGFEKNITKRNKIGPAINENIRFVVP